MTDAKSRQGEVQQLWSEYEVALWDGLAAIKRQDQIGEAELGELSAAHRRVLRTLNRLRELTDR